MSKPVFARYDHPLVGRHVWIGKFAYPIKAVDPLDDDLVLLGMCGGPVWRAILGETDGLVSPLDELVMGLSGS